MTEIAKRYDHYADRLKRAMKLWKFTNEGVAERLNAHPVTISKLRTRRLDLDDEWRDKIATRVFKLPESVLFGDSQIPPPRPFDIYISRKKAKRAKRHANDNLPHYGLAAGSMIGAHSMSNDLPEEVPCPPSLRHAIGAYALTTTGESMKPRYFPGERIYVNPNQKVHSGDHVVIQTANDDGTETTTWVKRFDAEDSDWIWVTQYNPESRIQFSKKTVRYMHRVLPVNELF